MFGARPVTTLAFNYRLWNYRVLSIARVRSIRRCSNYYSIALHPLVESAQLELILDGAGNRPNRPFRNEATATLAIRLMNYVIAS